MTTQQISTRLQTILSDIGISITSLGDDISFSKDLGLDSLDVTDLLIQVENSFSIRIADQDWWKLQTLKQLKDYLADELMFDEGQPV